MVKVEVTTADQSGVELKVTLDDGTVKTLSKSYQSLHSLNALIKGWYSGKQTLKASDPNSWFAPSVDASKKYNQEFLNNVIEVLGVDSFPVKSFFRLYDLNGKVFIITGASSGIGKVNAYQLAEMGAHLILACRSEAKTLPIIEDIKKKSGNNNVEFMLLDLINLDSVRQFVKNFLEKNLPLHVLINNAGGFLDGKTPYGIDATFGINHAGPFALTQGLLEVLKRTENSRIIFVSSKLAENTTTLPFDKIRAGIPLGATNSMESYSYSKLANVLFVKSITKQFKDNGNTTHAFALHPGVVATDIYRFLPSVIASTIKSFMVSEEEGSFMTLYTAVDPVCVGLSGSYFNYSKGFTPFVPSGSAFEDATLQQLCWEETSKIVGI